MTIDVTGCLLMCKQNDTLNMIQLALGKQFKQAHSSSTPITGNLGNFTVTFHTFFGPRFSYLKNKKFHQMSSIITFTYNIPIPYSH